jgi:epoxyqueuosine reductase
MNAPPFALTAPLAAAGLNHMGVVSVADYDATAGPSLQSQQLAPGSRSVMVFASGGPSLWVALLADLAHHPGHLTNEAHPLDAFVRRTVASVSGVIDGAKPCWFLAAADAEVQLDFRTLAVAAGLGAPSRLGLVIHPRWGPWMGLRAACFSALDLTPGRPLASVCDGCPAPCLSACPGMAFPAGQWDVHACSTFHQQSTECDERCAARAACPVGADARYPPMERLYHYNRRLGRLAIAESLGITDDQVVGVGPHWGDWTLESAGDGAEPD